MSTIEKLAISVPINKTAALVVSRGLEYVSEKKMLSQYALAPEKIGQYLGANNLDGKGKLVFGRAEREITVAGQ